MLRLFVAVPLPETIRSDLAGLCSGVPDAKWVARENMHLTLRFIGEVGRGDADDIHQALSRIRLPAFELVVSGVGCFESKRVVHTLWASVEKHELLSRLREKVEASLVRVGLEPERRKFKAHVTLARFRKGSGDRIGAYIENHNRFRTEPFPVEHFTLFRSHLGSQGPYYEPLAEYSLDLK